MGVKDLLGKILLAHPDQYTPEHLLKPENYQKVEKNCLSPPSIRCTLARKFALALISKTTKKYPLGQLCTDPVLVYMIV